MERKAASLDSAGIVAAIVLSAMAPVAGCDRDAGTNPGSSAMQGTQSAGGTGSRSPSPASMAKESYIYSPVRIAEGADGRLYVSDTHVDSVFIIRDLLVEAELKNLASPLGVAVDARGNTFVGNDGRDNVEVYGAAGNLLRTIGSGRIQMPNDLALDRNGNLYVADSLANAIEVFGPNGQFLRAVGVERLQFPVAVWIASVSGNAGADEVYVADQGHGTVQVFALDGTYLRSFGSRLQDGETDWAGKFVQLQSLAVDAQGRVHALDSVLFRVQMFDAVTGQFLGAYGSQGHGEGQLSAPLDIVHTAGNQIVVTNYGSHRIDVIRDLN
jgi:DNA-binding beta-propeller fold protein YncE